MKLPAWTAFASLLGTATLACPALQSSVALTPTDDTAPEAYIAIENIPLSAPFSASIEICDDIVKAIAFDAIMPAHRHGMNYRAETSQNVENGFRVDNIIFHMPGSWEMQIDVATADESFSYTHTVEAK